MSHRDIELDVLEVHLPQIASFLRRSEVIRLGSICTCLSRQLGRSDPVWRSVWRQRPLPSGAAAHARIATLGDLKSGATAGTALPEYSAARFEAAIRKADALSCHCHPSSLAVSAITLVRTKPVFGLTSGSVGVSAAPATADTRLEAGGGASLPSTAASATDSVPVTSKSLYISGPMMHLGTASVRHMQPLPCGGLVAALFSGQVFRLCRHDVDALTGAQSDTSIPPAGYSSTHRSGMRRSASADTGSLSDAALRLFGGIDVLSAFVGSGPVEPSTLGPNAIRGSMVTAVQTSRHNGGGPRQPNLHSFAAEAVPLLSGSGEDAAVAQAAVSSAASSSHPDPIRLSDASDGSAFAVCVLTPQWRHKADSEPPPTMAELEVGDVLVAVGRGDGSIDVRSVLTGEVVHRLFAHKMSVIDLVSTPYDFCGSSFVHGETDTLTIDVHSPQRSATELLTPIAPSMTTATQPAAATSGILDTTSQLLLEAVAAAPASAITSEDDTDEEVEEEDDGLATAGSRPGAIDRVVDSVHSELPPPRSLAPRMSHQQQRRRAWSHDRSILTGQPGSAIYYGPGGMPRRKWQSQQSSRPPLSFGSGSVFKPPTLLSVGRDGTLRSWDVVSGKQKAAAHHGAPVWTLVAYGPRVYTGGADGRIRVWSARTGRAVASFHVRRQVVCLAVVGETVLAGTNNGNLACIDAITGEQLWVKKLFRDRCAVRRLVLDCAAIRVVAVSQFGSLASIDLEL